MICAMADAKEALWPERLVERIPLDGKAEAGIYRCGDGTLITIILDRNGIFQLYDRVLSTEETEREVTFHSGAAQTAN